MASGASKISVAVEPPTAFIRITGRAAVENSRDFKALVLRLADGGIHHFVLDLRHCVLMDSTFSGILAGLVAPHFTDRATLATDHFTLVAPNERVTDLLDNLGVLPLVRRLDEDPCPNPQSVALDLERGDQTSREVAACCLEAHRILMALKPENVAKFRGVEQVLAAELDLVGK